MVCRASERKRYEVTEKTQVVSLHTSRMRSFAERWNTGGRAGIKWRWNTDDGESQKALGKVGLEWWSDNSERDIWASIIYKVIPDAGIEWPSPTECRENKIPSTEPTYSLRKLAGAERVVKIRQKQHLDRSEENRKATEIQYQESFHTKEVINNIMKCWRQIK